MRWFGAPFPSKDVQNKLETMRTSLGKVEDACATMAIRKAEFPNAAPPANGFDDNDLEPQANEQ